METTQSALQKAQDHSVMTNIPDQFHDVKQDLKHIGTKVDAVDSGVSEIKNDTAAIAAKVRGRHLTVNSFMTLTNALSHLPKTNAMVKYLIGDRETADFAREIGTAFAAGGFPTGITPIFAGPVPGLPPGLTITDDPRTPIPELSEQMCAALKSAGIPSRAARHFEAVRDSITIVVGGTE